MKYPNGIMDRLFANSVPEHTGHRINGEPSACWLWIGNKHPRGYGRLTLRVDGKHVKARAHRVSAQVFLGVKFDELHDTWEHHCRQTACIHPNHGEPLPNAVNAGGRRSPTRKA
jgi:hypothetical protein